MTAPPRDSGVAADMSAALAATGGLIGALRGAVCSVTLDGAGLMPRWTFGYSDEFLAGWTRFDLAYESPLTNAARLGATVALRSRDEVSARFPGIVHHTFDDTGALLSMPLTDVDGNVVGALGLSFPDGATLDAALPAVQALAPGLGRRLLLTDPGRVGVNEHGETVRLDEPQSMQRLAHRLISTLTAEEVVDVVDAHATAVVDAAFARVVLVDPADGTQTLVMAQSATPGVDERYAVIPADAPLPSTESARTGEPVWLRDRGELLDRFPALAEFPAPLEALAAVPLGGTGAMRGVLTIGWMRPVGLDAWEREACLQIAELCDRALGRAFSYTEQQRALAEAERATRRLQALTTLAAQLGACTTPQAVADVLVSTAVQTTGADAATVLALTGPEHAQVLAWESDFDLEATGITEVPLAELSLMREQMATRAPVYVRSHAERDARFPDMAGMEVEQQAWANLPLIVGDRMIGSAAFGWNEVRDFPADEREFLATIARHVAVALDRTTLMASARTASETLQQALLPEVGDVRGLEIVSRYVPVVEGADVGGDWYDVFALPGGRLGVTVGDVEGKGVAAAAVMGTVRSVLRAYATVTASPEVVLREVDDYLDTFGHHQMVTLCYAVVDPAARTLTYSSAGHPPPVLVTGGEAVWLDEGGGPPLGLLPGSARRATEVRLPETDRWVLLMYSDGLVERRSAMLREGMADVARSAPALADAVDLDACLGAIVTAAAGHPDRTYDDVAALAVRRVATG